MKVSNKSERVTNSLLYREIYLYNILDYNTNMYNPKKLSKYLQKDKIYLFQNNQKPKFQKEYWSVI